MIFQGIGISSGIRRAVLWSVKEEWGDDTKGENVIVEHEIDIVNTAFTNVILEYELLIPIANTKVGRTAALIVEGHRLMASDLELQRKVSHLISSEKLTAELALWTTINEYVEMMKQSENTYLRGRSNDLMHLSRTLITQIKKIKALGKDLKNLDSKQNQFLKGNANIIMGEGFGVEDVLLWNEHGVIGMIDFLGEEEGHVTVIAKSLGLPMIIQMDPLLMKLEGKEVWMDGTTGSVNTE